ncbi:hypothetical protein BC939DRAFT_245687 [Gamsiella multidivaricata]|uniref:uncharacterized protein n=1 Tax=Gamsiella multidivaricata TaxID=101098 RepID=UPI002220878C|nr:uncharacterized protein BC939DRAFT_245687 [Gamsiella multidivaricata]KAI7819905.1 hypothetical protein BC939DRAFT_245687 [Gamsiella multidivaricata]
MAAAWSWKRRHWPTALLVLCALLVQVHAFFHVEQHSDNNNQNNPDSDSNTQFDTHSNTNTRYSLSRQEHLHQTTCVCLQQDNPAALDHYQQCSSHPYPFCLHDRVQPGLLGEGSRHFMSLEPESGKNDGHHIIISDAGSANQNDDETRAMGVSAPGATDNNPDHQASPTNQPVSGPTIVSSTVVVYPQNQGASTVMQIYDSHSIPNGVDTNQAPITSDAAHVNIVINSSTSTLSEPPVASIHHPSSTIAVSTATSATPTPTSQHQTERHIPSYEQWRKQVLEKKKPADPNERKLRKRKPYQENAVDVAIGGEDELGFVFPNMDNGSGSGKGGDDRFLHPSDQLGNGPDLKRDASKDKEWIKSEYAKDPKDRFNHASATCAASVVKASKDATSIMAILNEGKDNYMLNKCSTKDKFFVVELCEEILVDTFVLGNYEFFSSTFKDFVVSVNRYPPRDDGWSILGHFQARNTRDAQVFKPSVPQLATYIRFDFLSHYGNEYYCPVTLLRVYGATALEQLKQEEEEEKRQAEEEKRLAALEKARQSAAEADDADDTDETEVVEAEGSSSTEATRTGVAVPTQETVIEESHHATHNEKMETATTLRELETSTTTGDSVTPTETSLDSHTTFPQDKEHDDHGANKEPGEEHPYLDHPVTDYPPLMFQEGSGTGTEDPLTHWEESAAGHAVPSDTILKSFEETTTTSTEHSLPTGVLPPPASTSPASMQDDAGRKNAGLGMVMLSPKARPGQLPRPPGASKPVSAGVGTTTGGASSAGEASSQSSPFPSPQHSSQESVYKNIVNRLKVLELNSSLSYQYLEEQSNIYNDVLESSEQKINQLVSHLNEATRRLETLGRKYDQLAYSYRAHVEVDGEKRRQDFINLSSQVHLLGAQIMFQRQLFVVGAITIFSIIASIAITRSTTMHYAIQHSPLGEKLRAISGHRRQGQPNDIASSVRIGSVEGLSQFDQKSLLFQRAGERRDNFMGKGTKLTPLISPMSPLTPDPNHAAQSRLLDECESKDSFLPDSGTSLQNENTSDRSYSRENGLPHPGSELSSSMRPVTSPDMNPPSDPPLDRFTVSRTPYPTPKNSYGPSRLFLHPNNSSSSQRPSFPNDYRPDSPVFQGPSSVHDDGQLSDADVAYMSRDMNVGRKSPFSPGSIPTSPAIRRLSAGFYNHQPHYHGNQAILSRPLSSLRVDTTASLSMIESYSPETAHHSSDDNAINSLDPTNDPAQPQENESRASQESSDFVVESLIKTPEIPTRSEFEEDLGFVSDSVLDSASESIACSRNLIQPPGALGDWDRQHGEGEVLLKHKDDEIDQPLDTQRDEQTVNEASEGNVVATLKKLAMERPRLSRDPPLKSRHRSSHNVFRLQEYSNTSQTRSHSASDALGLGVGLGLDVGSENSPSPRETLSRPEPSFLFSHNSNRRGLDEDGADDDGAQADDDSAVVPQGQGVSDRRKKSRKPPQPDDQVIPARRMSYGRRESAEAGFAEDKGGDGDDERSPQVSRKAGS